MKQKLLSLLSNLKLYRKSVVAGLGLALTLLNIVYGTNPKVQLAISVATLLGVYHAPNAQQYER